MAACILVGRDKAMPGGHPWPSAGFKELSNFLPNMLALTDDSVSASGCVFVLRLLETS